MAQVKLMVLGAGFFARKWLETVRGREDCAVVGLASRTQERAAQLLKDVGVEGVRLYDSWAAAAASRDADAVLITLPQALHPAATVRALESGRHVFVEKPLALDLAGARSVYEAAESHPDRVVMVNQNFRWRPHVQALRRGVRDGLVGRVGHVMWECRQQIRRTTVDGWREQMAEPFLLDFAIHHFDMMRHVLGDEPRRVLARSFRPPWSWFEGNPAAAAIVEMQRGGVIDYGGTMASLGLETPQEGVITIMGEAGTLRLDGESQVQHVAGGRSSVLPQAPIPGGELGHALDEFLAAVRERRQPVTGVAEHVRSLGLTLAAAESARSGRVVECQEMIDFLR